MESVHLITPCQTNKFWTIILHNIKCCTVWHWLRTQTLPTYYLLAKPCGLMVHMSMWF